MKTKVRKIGNSYGIVLPKEALHAMKVKEGSALYLTEAPDNGLLISTGDERFDTVMRIAEKGMQSYRNALRELAK